MPPPVYPLFIDVQQLPPVLQLLESFFWLFADPDRQSYRTHQLQLAGLHPSTTQCIEPFLEADRLVGRLMMQAIVAATDIEEQLRAKTP
jgi:hypothetical protein